MISDATAESIIQSAFEGKTAPYASGKPPSLVVLGGLPAAGKTTVSSEHDEKNFVYASPDWVKAQAKNYSVEFHSTATQINTKIINEARKSGYNLLYDSLLDNYGRAAGTIRQYLAKNGAVLLIYVDVSYETSLARALAREVMWKLEEKTVRLIPTRVIIRSYNYSLSTMLALLVKYESDPRVRFLIYNNDRDFKAARLIAEKTKDSLLISSEKMFDALTHTDYHLMSEGHYERKKTLDEEGFDECRPRAYHRAVNLVIEKSRASGRPEMEREVYERLVQEQVRRDDPLTAENQPE